jgi:hypothetical protein
MMQAAQIPAVCAAAPPVATDAREPLGYEPTTIAWWR